MKLIFISFLFSFFILLNLTSNEKSSSSRNWYEKKRIAFILGINDYQNTTNLKYAVKDSREIKDLFLEVGYFDKIYLLNDLDGLQVYEDKKIYSNQKLLPYKKNIEEIYKYILNEKPNTLLFYYSGHGFVEGIDNKNSIAPKDAEVIFKKNKPIAKNGILISEMADGFLKSQPKNFKNPEQVIFLIDACRSPLPEDNLEESKIKKTKFVEVSAKDFDFLKNYSSTKKFDIEKFDEKVPKLVNEAKGVVILIGTSPNQSSLEEDDIESGKFSYYLKKAISGAVQDETPAEYVTLDSLELYVKKKFDLEYEEYINSKRNEKEFVQTKPIQALYKLSTEAGFTGDFLISYSRPKMNQSIIDRRFYQDDSEVRAVEAKLLFKKNLDRYDLKFFAKSKETGRYYPESLEGISRLKYNLDRNQKNELIGFVTEQFNYKEESVFTHSLEESNGVWDYSGIYIPTDEDKKNEFKKKIKFQKQKFDVNGNNLSQEFFDKDGKQISLDSGYAVRVEKKWNEFGEKILEQYYDFRNKLISYNGLYSYYVAKYLDKEQPLFEEFRLNEKELGENDIGISKIEYSYDKEYKLILIQYLDKNLSLISNLNHISKKEFTYNNSCVKRLEKMEFSKSEYKNLSLEKLKLEKEKFYKKEKFDSCIETEINFDKEGKLKSDQDGVAKRIFKFNPSGLKISEEYYRQTGKPIQKKGIFRTEYSYDNQDRMISKKYYSDKNEKISDESGIHEYRYNFGNGKKYYLNYNEELLESITYFDEKGEKVLNSENIFEEEMLYIYNKEEKKYKLEVTHYLDKDGKLIKLFPLKTQTLIFDTKGNLCNHISYSWKGNILFGQPHKISISEKFIYIYDKNFRYIGDVNYYGENSPLNYFRKLVYDENDNVISEEYLDLNEKPYFEKEFQKLISTYNSKNQILTREYFGKNEKFNEVVKEVYIYDKNGNLIQIEYLDKFGQLATSLGEGERFFSKIIRKYDEKNNLIEEENFDSKEKLSDSTGRHLEIPAKKNFTYNQNSKIIKKEFFGIDGKPKSYNFSIYSISDFENLDFEIDKSSKVDYKYDEKQKLIEMKFDFFNSEQSCSIRYQRIKFKDEKISFVEFSDEDGKLILNKCINMARIVYTYDKKMNLIREEYFDQNLKSKADQNGIIKIIYQYDGNGNKILQESYGENLKLKNFSNGPAKYIWKYNSKNQIISEETFDENTEYLNTNSPAKVIYDYDERGNQVSLEYFKDKTTPIDSFGFSKSLIQFNINSFDEVENENKEEWRKIKMELIKIPFFRKLINFNSTVYSETGYLMKDSEKFSTELYKALGINQGYKFILQIEEFRKKIIKEVAKAIFKSYKLTSKGELKLNEERFDRKRAMILETKNIDRIIQVEGYDLYFPNPKGSLEKNLIHLKLDRFFRPYEINFEKR